MKIIITSGGTSENIDKVRKITNNSSGKLGSMIANELINNFDEKIQKIYYICDKKAVLPSKNEKIENIIVSNVQSLSESIERLLLSQQINIVIHSMAVSDYTVDYVTSSQTLSEHLQNKSKEQISSLLNSKTLAEFDDGKISSNCSDLFIKLKQTPKVISKIKKLSPKTVLVGFKLLVGASREKLLEVANNLMKTNKCDYVLANDLSLIDKNSHKAYLLGSCGQLGYAENKEQIAKMLAKEVMR